jgi:hypothetical protein
MACAKVAQRKGGISARLRRTNRLSARMLIKIRNDLVVMVSRRLNVLHALSNVLQAECRGFKINFSSITAKSASSPADSDLEDTDHR